MKFLYLLALFIPGISLAAGDSGTDRLTTPTYIIEITELCEEGVVGCSNVTYVGTNIKTSQSITLEGKAIMHMCADEVTPCHHEGYEFKNGNVSYKVTPDGALIVSRNKKVLLREHGKWQW
jgi:hypothetical protein